MTTIDVIEELTQWRERYQHRANWPWHTTAHDVYDGLVHDLDERIRELTREAG